jgi:DNA-binding HxlR family transcriptional regulator
MALLDLLGRRWTLRVLWELHDGAPATFRELQARCGQMSSSVLAQRLAELAEAGIVSAPDGTGYALTGQGRSLLDALAPLNDWAKEWARRAQTETVPTRRSR